ncbi:MAG: HAD family hydrolase [Leptolinea sp.]|jgi:sugar-phosphatase|nr:HAD family hydrolase [Leptolinea sp.]
MGTSQIQRKTHIECRAVLFDLDGVLIDSTECILRHWRDWAEKNHVDIRKIERVAHGLRTVETMRLVAPHQNVEQDAATFHDHELLDTEGIIAIDGALRLLTALPEWSWTIVTSASRDLVKVRMAKAGLQMPEKCVTADDVRNGKPSPEPYLLGAEKLGNTPQECVVVEDAPSGIEAGKKAGMRVIAIASTHSRQTLLETEADYIVDRLLDLHISSSDDDRILSIMLE